MSVFNRGLAAAEVCMFLHVPPHTELLKDTLMRQAAEDLLGYEQDSRRPHDLFQLSHVCLLIRG